MFLNTYHYCGRVAPVAWGFYLAVWRTAGHGGVLRSSLPPAKAGVIVRGFANSVRLHGGGGDGRLVDGRAVRAGPLPAKIADDFAVATCYACRRQAIRSTDVKA